MPEDTGSGSSPQTPFQRLNDVAADIEQELIHAGRHQQHQEEEADFFDAVPTHEAPSINSSARHLLDQQQQQEGFVFDGDDECAVIVAPASPPPSSPYVNYYNHHQSNNNSNTEPLLQQPQFCGDNDEQDHLSVEEEDDDDHPVSRRRRRRGRFSSVNSSRRNRTPYRISELSGLNILNLTIWLVYLAVHILFGSGLVELELQQHNSTHTWILPSTWTVTTLPTYETLLTPAQWAGDYLWIPVVALEGLFALVQLLPQIRSRTMVVSGVGYLWFYIGLGQCLTTIFFCLKWIIPAWCTLAVTAFTLFVLQWQQQHSTTTTNRACPTSQIFTQWEYWVFRFPFDIHLGWVLPLLASRASMIFRHYGTHNVGLQLAADIVAMALLLPCAGSYLYRAQGPPDWVVPLMIGWAYIGIACRLGHTLPDSKLVETYGPDIVVAVRDAAWCFAGTVGLFTIPQIVIWVAREFLTIHVVQLNDDEEEEDQEAEHHNGHETEHLVLVDDPSDSVVFGMVDF